MTLRIPTTKVIPIHRLAAGGRTRTAKGRTDMTTHRKPPASVRARRAPALAFGALGAALCLGQAEALTPPKYLGVPHVRQCLSQKSAGAYDTVCLPAARPDQCPDSSWRALKALDGDDRVPPC